MSFEPTELQRKILGVVHGLQHGKCRHSVPEGSVVTLGAEVPSDLIRAELVEDNGRMCDEKLNGLLGELVTRQLLGEATHEYDNSDVWSRELAYRRPDGRVVTARINREVRLREVLLDDERVVDDWDPDHGQACGYTVYWITAKGLTVLDSRMAPVEPAAKPEYTPDSIPPLDKDSGEWVPRKKPSKGKYKDLPSAVELTGRENGTLRNDLSDGQKFDDGLKGIDRRNRIWRKESKNSQDVWYLKKTLSVD